MSEFTRFTVHVEISVKDRVEVSQYGDAEPKYADGRTETIATLTAEGPRPFVKEVLASIGMALDEIETV